MHEHRNTLLFTAFHAHLFVGFKMKFVTDPRFLSSGDGIFILLTLKLPSRGLVRAFGVSAGIGETQMKHATAR